MLVYVLSLLNLRVNEKEKIFPDGYDGDTENIEAQTIGVFLDKNEALNKLNNYFISIGRNDVSLKTYQKGNVLSAELTDIEYDESGNKWYSRLSIKTIDTNKEIDIEKEVMMYS